MLRAIILVTALTWLSGCAAETSSLEIYCPTIKVYSEDYTQQLANELTSLPSDTNISEALSDYSSLRANIRKCQQLEEGY
jgi:hypothetical protein